MGGFDLFRGDALDAYQLAGPRDDRQRRRLRGAKDGFHGDTIGPEALPRWYRPHVAAWARPRGPATTLWFWNTELGWAR